MAEDESGVASSGPAGGRRVRDEVHHLYRLASLNADPHQRRALLARAHRLEQEAQGRVVPDLPSPEPKAWKEG